MRKEKEKEKERKKENADVARGDQRI